jgi:asparagine synthetase B (glutamine-hydrolysing)
MFDLIGVAAIGPSAESGPRRRLAALPAETWCPAPPHRIDTGRLGARYLTYGFGPGSYATAEEHHLFVVGEVYARRRAAAGPLAASDLLPWYERDTDDLLARTKGNFTLVFVDQRRGRAELIGSRLAISPFYYAVEGKRFVFSTALSALIACLSPAPALDLAGVAELALFNYPLGDRTYVRGVKMLRPAERVQVSGLGASATRWWDVRSLYALPRLPEPEALDTGGRLLHAAVNDLASDIGRVRVSFTSGFDSRAILALLEKSSTDVLTYAFGVPGSLNVSIPLELSKRFGFQFDPIYLGPEYEARFDENALRAVELSDCLATVERANYPYAFERNADFSPVILTGLFGSELLRTFQNIGHIISGDLVRVHLSPHPRTTVRQLMQEPSDGRYFSDLVLRSCIEEVEEDVQHALVEPFGDLTDDQRFYMFLLSEGLRKYFGAEVHMERPWGRNRFPFLDEEFVEFAFQSPFAGVHSRTLTPTIANRFRSQYFYADVIRRYRPELLSATTDHGYAPAALLSRFPLLSIGPSVLAHRWRRRGSGYREFNTEQWTAQLYARRVRPHTPPERLFAPRFAADLASGHWLTHRLGFARAASFMLWLQQRADTVTWP